MTLLKHNSLIQADPLFAVNLYQSAWLFDCSGCVLYIYAIDRQFSDTRVSVCTQYKNATSCLTDRIFSIIVTIQQLLGLLNAVKNIICSAGW